MEINLLEQLGVALGLGLLVGFQREWGLPHVAGIRSFAMIPPLGVICAHLSLHFGAWIAAAGFIALAVVLVTGGLIKSIIQLVLFALVIPPILPNNTYGPYDVFNPFHAWAMVVLIVGISVIGFMTYKLFGARAGTLLNGLLGGVISSTAATVGYAQRTSKNPDMGKTAAVIIMIASTVVFFRVSFEVFVVGPEVLPHLAPLLAVMVVFMGAICAVLYLTAIEQDSISIPTTNPSNLKAAIVFGVLYVAVLFAVAAAKKHCSESGLYLVAALSIACGGALVIFWPKIG